MRLGWGALLAVVVLSTACAATGRGGATASGTPAYVPWLPLARTGAFPQAPRPSPSPPIPIPPGTPACTSAQLDVVSYRGSGATGHTDMPLLFRNRSTTECFLEGYSDVTVLDARGNVLAAGKGSGLRGTFFDYESVVVPILMKTGTSLVVNGMRLPQGQALVDVGWVDCSMPTAARVVVDLPDGGGTVAGAYPVRAGYSPVCDSGPGIAPQPSVGRGPFMPTGVQWPPSPVYITTTVTINARDLIKRGSTLVYYVTVRNTSDIDYVLDPCPDYNEFLGKKDLVASYRLNCAPVGHIAPGVAVTFEMRMTLPDWIESGPSRLSWSLGDGRLDPATATVPIIIG